MAETVVVGARITDLIAPRQIYRLSIYQTGFALSGLWRGGWESQVSSYVEGMPGSGLGFILGGWSVDTVKDVAVLDFRVASDLVGVASVSLGELLRKLADYLPGAAIDRVTRIDGDAEAIRNRELELQGAVDRDSTREQSTGFLGWVNDLKAMLGKAFGALLAVIGLALLAFLLIRFGKRSAP